ncbi:MAG TPA: FAD-dependent monooxygenase [Chloroflexota bacterium]|nr:FAD-dependent monooxygenase [Chloroflexota bacterium]
MLTETPVLIAGGGPTGLAAALELGTRGIDCLVLEPRQTVAFDRPRAKTTSVRSMEHFRRWGLATRIRAVAPLPVAWSQDAVFCTSLLGDEITRIHDVFALTAQRSEVFAETSQQIPQPLVEQVMRDALRDLPSVTFAAGWSLTRLAEGSAEVRVVAHSAGVAREIRAQYVLGCEGATSPTRAAIGARYVGRSDLRPNFNVVFRAPGLGQRVPHGPAVHYWVLNTAVPGLVGRLDLQDTWWAMAMGVEPDVGNADPYRLIRGLVGGDIEADVLSTDPWTARMLLVDRYQSERVFLAGDAAHLNPPWGGHGFNTGLGDAVNVGWKLAATIQGWVGPAVLGSYQEERRPVAQRTIDDATRNMSMLSAELAAAAGDADLIHRAKESEFHSLGLVLGYAYNDSRIIVRDGSPAALPNSRVYEPTTRPGARLPHTWLADGRSLYDALGPDLTVLQVSASADPSALLSAARQRGVPLALLDVGGLDLSECLKGSMLIVRPDQHVAWRSSAGTLDERDAHGVLDTILGCANNGGGS